MAEGNSNAAEADAQDQPSTAPVPEHTKEPAGSSGMFRALQDPPDMSAQLQTPIIPVMFVLLCSSLDFWVASILLLPI